MKLVVVLLLLVPCCWSQSNFDLRNDGSYRFSYNTLDEGEHSRSETQAGPDAPVVGKYSYRDPNGYMREVRYTADKDGFRPEGDISVDRKTAEEAAALALLAPKDPNLNIPRPYAAPVVAVVAPAAPVAPGAPVPVPAPTTWPWASRFYQPPGYYRPYAPMPYYAQPYNRFYY